MKKKVFCVGLIIFIFIILFLLNKSSQVFQSMEYYSGVWNFFVLLISASLLLWQIISQNIWIRKKNSLELISQIFKGDMLKVKSEVDKYLRKSSNFLNETYKEIADNIHKEEKEKLDECLQIYLNYLEGIALGIKYKVYEEQMLYDYIESIITQIYRWAKPYIEEMRKKFGDKELYIELEKLAEKWNKIKQNRKEKYKNAF